MKTRSLAFALILLPTLLSAAQAQPAFLVKDIGDAVASESPLGLPLFSAPGNGAASVELDGVLYFSSGDGVHGGELWRSDGTIGGTHMLQDVCPGICSSSPRSLTVFQHKIYWAAWDGEQSLLLTSDGTPQGTAPFPGPASPAGRVLAPLGEAGGRLLLSGHSGDSFQGELWATDGTAAGTVRLRVFHTSPGATLPAYLSPIGQAGGACIFSTGYATDGQTLWATDGTAAGTVPLYGGTASGVIFVRAAAAGGRLFLETFKGTERVALVSDGTPAGTQTLAGVSFDNGLTAVGAQVFFDRSTAAGWELWKSDGTVAGTSLVKAHPEVSNLPDVLTAVGSRLFFELENLGGGQDLWVSDGTAAGTRLVQQISGAGSNFAGAWPGQLRAFGDRLAFFADDGVHGLQPWMSDGTAAGTYMVAELHPGPAFGSRSVFLGGRWLFDARDSQGWFLWATDGTPGSLSKIRRLDVQTSSSPSALTDLGGTLLFAATNAASGQELWRTDGSATGTFQVKDIAPGTVGSFPAPLARIVNQLFFGAATYSGPGFFPSFSLWATDGTEAGTRRVPDASPLSLSSRTGAQAGEALYLSASSSEQTGLFKTDGTDAGTALLQSFANRVPRQLTAAGDRLFFDVFKSGSNELLLWTSNGTAAGTKPVLPGHPFPNLYFWGALGSRLLFSTDDAAGRELWTSNGTVAGTYRLTRIAVVKPGGLPREVLPGSGLPAGFLAVAAGRAFFVGDDGVHGAELWSTDGTAPGTRMVADIFRGPSGSSISSLTAVGSRVFFAAGDGAHGRELWVSDGTAVGTHMVADIVHGAGSSLPGNLAAVDGLLLFSAYDGVHGVEPWVSDGTRAGTRMLQDIAPGPLPSSPSGFLASGPYVYFSATDAVHGFELWAVPRTALTAQP